MRRLLACPFSPRKREVDLGDDGVLVADDAGEELAARLQQAQEVVANLVLDGLRLPAAVPKLLESGRSLRHQQAGSRVKNGERVIVMQAGTGRHVHRRLPSFGIDRITL
jgi:hypothetical protein